LTIGVYWSKTPAAKLFVKTLIHNLALLQPGLLWPSPRRFERSRS
jgi:hypothetical protein